MDESWQGIRLSLASDVRYLEPIRTMIRESTELAGLSEDESDEIVLAVQEACANVIRHCYKNCPDERMDLLVTFHDDALEIRIDDFGEFVDPATIKGRALEDVKPGGLGVHFMKKVMDEVKFEKNEWGGTSLTMVKRLSQGESQ